MKIPQIKNWKLIIITGAVILGALFLVFILYYNYYFKKDNLIRYFPYNTSVYANFTLTNELKNIKAYQKMEALWGIERFDWNALNKLNGKNISFGLVPQLKNGQYEFHYLGIIDFASASSLKSFAQLVQRHALSSYQIENQILPANMLAFSDSADIIRLVSDIDRQKAISLSNHVGAVISLNSISSKYFGRLYINLAPLEKNWTALNDLKLKMLALGAKNEKIGDLCLGARIDNNQIVIETPNLAQSVTLPPLAGEWAVNLNNLANSWHANFDLIAQADPALYYSLKQKLADWQGIYKFNLETDILPLFSGQTQVFKFENEQFLVNLDLNQTKIDQNQVLKQVEGLAREYLAVKNPRQIVKILPDGSEITEIMKDNHNLELKSEDQVYYLTDKQTEIAWKLSEGRLWLSNSVAKIKENPPDSLPGDNSIYLNMDSDSYFIQKLYLNIYDNYRILAIFE